MNEKNFRAWLEEKSNWAKEKVHNASEWCKRNQAVIVVFGPVVCGTAIEVAKIVAKRKTVKDEKSLKENYIYDRSAGHYYELKRQPENYEYLQIDQRKTNGESLGQILMDMKLLK